MNEAQKHLRFLDLNGEKVAYYSLPALADQKKLKLSALAILDPVAAGNASTPGGGG